MSEVLGGLFLLKAPTFKPFTEILLKMARDLPSLTVLQISNQHVVQVRCEWLVVNERVCLVVLDSLKNSPGCEVNFEFRFPDVGTAENPRKQISLAVKVSNDPF